MVRMRTIQPSVKINYPKKYNLTKKNQFLSKFLVEREIDLVNNVLLNKILKKSNFHTEYHPSKIKPLFKFREGTGFFLDSKNKILKKISSENNVESNSLLLRN